jgi:hypothetical protein
MGYKLEHMDHPVSSAFALFTPCAPNVDQAEGCEEPRRELTIFSIRNQCVPKWRIRITAHRHVDFCMAELKDRQKGYLDRCTDGECLPSVHDLELMA